MCTHLIAGDADAVRLYASGAVHSSQPEAAANLPHANSAQNALYIISITTGDAVKVGPIDLTTKPPDSARAARVAAKDTCVVAVRITLFLGLRARSSRCLGPAIPQRMIAKYSKSSPMNATLVSLRVSHHRASWL